MFKPFKARAIIHSNKSESFVTILHEKDNDNIVVEHRGVRYSAIFNLFLYRYFVEDLHGKLPDQSTCPCCGKKLPAFNQYIGELAKKTE